MKNYLLNLIVLLTYVAAVISTHQTVIPSAIAYNYQMGVERYRSVIDFLIAGIGDQDPVEWINQLKKFINAIHSSFQISLEESEKAIIALDQESNALGAQTGSIDREIERINDGLLRLEINIAHQRLRVNAAQNEVSQAETLVENQQNQVNNYARELDKVKTGCLRRRKRWASKLKNAFRRANDWTQKKADAVGEWTRDQYDETVAGICDAVSRVTGDIQSAQRKLNLVEGDLENAKKNLAQHNEQLYNARRELADQQLQLETKKVELRSTNRRSKYVRNQLMFVGRINKALKTVIIQIDEIAARSSLAKEEFVADFDVHSLETLIFHLNRIADLLISHTRYANVIKLSVLSQENARKIESNIERLQLLYSEEERIFQVAL